MTNDKVANVITMIMEWIRQIYLKLESITFLNTNLLDFLLALLAIKIILSFIKAMDIKENIKTTKIKDERKKNDNKSK